MIFLFLEILHWSNNNYKLIVFDATFSTKRVTWIHSWPPETIASASPYTQVVRNQKSGQSSVKTPSPSSGVKGCRRGARSLPGIITLNCLWIDNLFRIYPIPACRHRVCAASGRVKLWIYWLPGLKWHGIELNFMCHMKNGSDRRALMGGRMFQIR